MPNSELMAIGAFAQRSGLTSSALRFYADSGLLPPADVDPATGYRSYGVHQLERAVTLRRLREIAMPLAGVAAVLGAGAEEAARLLDEHVARIEGEAAVARQRAAAIKSALGGDAPGSLIAVLKGPVLAEAVEQVLTATATPTPTATATATATGPTHDPASAVLAGLHIEASDEAVALTATDRYRLSTRTLVPVRTGERTWAGTVDGADLRNAVADVRRSALVRVEAVPHGIWLRMSGREDRHCRVLPEEYPDHRSLLASLGEATTRATVAKGALLRALEEHPGDRPVLRLTDRGLRVQAPDDELSGIRLPAAVTGEGLRIRFEMTTLYAAVSTAIGPDVMLDLRGPLQPVTIRSADRGDLTTLTMPVTFDH
ncbi:MULTISPECIES: MerR family transcriptional regulator [Streptomyces]|uniref:MerR family transcriptional regulator n=1 Tax=Streptomyces TaxID=1883 RepID=UPI00168B0005|nr:MULTISPECIES: MerR family transcriptional regulator [Streptomyces]MBD3550498.1 MerR family transcriptional regulator [Streptomyces sp. JV180]MCC0575945.1 MerR family transcriptional regulator [Streptomyces californicus]